MPHGPYGVPTKIGGVRRVPTGCSRGVPGPRGARGPPSRAGPGRALLSFLPRAAAPAPRSRAAAAAPLLVGRRAGGRAAL